jgi:hypothetical protein
MFRFDISCECGEVFEYVEGHLFNADNFSDFPKEILPVVVHRYMHDKIWLCRKTGLWRELDHAFRPE